MSGSLLDQAIRLLNTRRLPMLPSSGAKKAPSVPWKRFQTTLPTEADLRMWDRRFQPERWGFVSGALAGIIVLDFDGEGGKDLMRKWGINPHLRTGSGGFHLHVLHPGWPIPTLNAKSSKNVWPWRGLDVRGDGGFAILLGRNEHGPYRQLRELAPECFDVIPVEVRDYLRQHSQKFWNPRRKPLAPRRFHFLPLKELIPSCWSVERWTLLRKTDVTTPDSGWQSNFGTTGTTRPTRILRCGPIHRVSASQTQRVNSSATPRAR